MYILESLPVAFFGLLLTATLFMPQRPAFRAVFTVFTVYYASMLVDIRLCSCGITCVTSIKWIIIIPNRNRRICGG
jgi:hypothetical protein